MDAGARHGPGGHPRRAPPAPDPVPSLDGNVPAAFEKMGRLKGVVDADTAKELRDKRVAEREREGRVAAVGAQYAAQKTAARGALFDGEDWRKAHTQRQERMESTFTRLYQPQSKAYWTQSRNERRPKRPPPGAHMLPAYVNDLPHALSLSHPASREENEDEEADLAEEAEAPPAAEEVFDPMAGPVEFYKNFKERVAALRKDVAAPPPVRTTREPRKAEKALAAALAEKAPAEALVEPEVEGEDEVDASLVYTDSAQYLAEFGVALPMWDEAIDEQIKALDLAHMAAMDAVDDFELSAEAPGRLDERLVELERLASRRPDDSLE